MGAAEGAARPTTLIHVDDVVPEGQDTASGWSISEFRLPIDVRVGAGSAVFHGRFRPGSQHEIHRHDHCDELCFYLRGHGRVGTGEDRYTVGPGDVRRMPRGVDHYFFNAGDVDVAEVLGVYVDADSVAATGYGHGGAPSAEDLARSARGDDEAALKYPLAHAADAAPLAGAGAYGWSDTEYRELLGAAGPPASHAFTATVAAGGGRAPHRTTAAETIYHVVEGTAAAGDADGPLAMRPGHVWRVPAGAAAWLRNDDAEHPLRLVGFVLGAADSATAGHEPADLPTTKAPTP